MTTEPFSLIGSRDELTGDVFFPGRALSVDGQLRPLTDAPLPTEGTLYSYAPMGDVTFGLIDLDGGVRLQAQITGTDHEIGAPYRLIGDATDWKFTRA